MAVCLIVIETIYKMMVLKEFRIDQGESKKILHCNWLCYHTGKNRQSKSENVSWISVIILEKDRIMPVINLMPLSTIMRVLLLTGGGQSLSLRATNMHFLLVPCPNKPDSLIGLLLQILQKLVNQNIIHSNQVCWCRQTFKVNICCF